MSGVPIPEAQVDKGLKPGALSLVSNIVIGVASVAPAYSLAATLGFIVILVGFSTPSIVLLAFIPMLFVSIGYSELNKADPDCGTTFTWATRAFGPRTGWMGGWGIIAADILVMASLAQVASQYTFLLFNANSIGTDPTSVWVLLVGLLFIALMTYICYRGIEVSARIQRVLLSIEVVMLLALGLVALIRALTGNAPAGHATPSLDWLNPGRTDFSTLVSGLLLMLFIYWGWDTSVSINEETADRTRSPASQPSPRRCCCWSCTSWSPSGCFPSPGPDPPGSDSAIRTTRETSSHRLGTAVFGNSALGNVLFAPPPAHGAELGSRIDTDDDPSHRTHHAVDVRVQGAARRVRQNAPALLHPNGCHARDGRGIGRAVRGGQLHL